MKIETFRGDQDFFGPLNGTSNSEGHFGAQKVEAPSKSRDFHGDPLEMNGMMAFPAGRNKMINPPQYKAAVSW